MNGFHQIIAKAARREWINRALHTGGRAVVGGLVLGLVLLAIDRLAGLRLPVTALLAPPAVCLLIGLAYAALARRDRVVAAVHLDRALRLKDRMGTAQALQQRAPGAVHDQEFA